MKKILLFVSLLYFVNLTYSQVFWSEHAAEVLYNNCTSCHNPNGIGPFSLIDYPDAFENKNAIKFVVENSEMPPWTADTSYQSYFHERVLTQEERDILITWVDDGGLEGDPLVAPPPPVYENEQVIPTTPDLVVEMPLYMSKATSEGDDYICIAIPTGLTADKKIKAIEIIPGNRAIVHHCLVFKDPSATYITDTIGGDCGGPSIGELIAGYTPGASPTIFPSADNFASGITLEAGSNLIFGIHYPEGSYGEYDQTKVNIYFYPESVENFREVYVDRLLENWVFILPPNTATTIQDNYFVSNDITLMSVFPHMHLLGTYIESHAISPSNDTIPLVRINEWDFEWQDFYFFEYLQTIPSGSTMYGIGIYDNSASNPNNPNSPPVYVLPGLNTTDEMFLFYFHYMAYETGDELINVDSLNNLWLAGLATSFSDQMVLDKNEIKTFPNPFSDQVAIDYVLVEQSFVSLFIYDFNGKLIKKLFSGKQSKGDQQVIWNGKNSLGANIPSGLYFYSLLINGENYSGKLVFRE